MIKALLYLSLILIFSSCATPKSIDSLLILPTPIQNPKYTVSGNTIIYEDKNISIVVKHLNPLMLNNYYQERNLINPFADFPADKKFTIFAVRFLNNSKDKITYNPMMSAIFEGNEKPIRPIDVTDFYMLLSEDPNVEARMKMIKKTAYDVQFVLQNGEKKDALLIFPAIDLSTKVVILMLKDVYFGFKWANIPFAFDVTEKKEE
ncbi:MAG: hypothetical protein AABY58_10055 [Nitrospirota bacterium]